LFCNRIFIYLNHVLTFKIASVLSCTECYVVIVEGDTMRNNKTYILIADDEKDIRDILKLLLEGEGYEVLAVSDGQEVIEATCSEMDLYILDHVLFCLSIEDMK